MIGFPVNDVKSTPGKLGLGVSVPNIEESCILLVSTTNLHVEG